MKEIYFEESTGFTYEKKECGGVYYVPIMKCDNVNGYYPSIDYATIKVKRTK